jgi:hypothetical protein
MKLKIVCRRTFLLKTHKYSFLHVTRFHNLALELITVYSWLPNEEAAVSLTGQDAGYLRHIQYLIHTCEASGAVEF